MRLISTLLVAVAAVAVNQVVAEPLVLTTENFKETIENNDYVLAEFYAPWCGHCKALVPEYEKAAAALADFEPKVILATIDATVEEALAKEYGIQGFPTLKWFSKGEAKEYGGGRTESTIVSWIKKKVGDPAAKLEDVAALEAFKEANEVVVVGVFATAEEAATFTAAASDEEEVPFGIVIGNAEVAKAVGVESGVVVFKKFDDLRAEYTGDATDKEALTEFVSGNVLPLIVAFSQENAPKIFGGKIKSHTLVFVDSSEVEAKEKVIAEVRPVAESKKGKMLFVSVDKSDDRILEFFGITAEQMPTVRIVNMGEGSMKKFSYEADTINTADLEKFVAAYEAGELAPQLKSDEIPETNDGPVFVAVGKNFEELTSRPGVNVLVEFYAPWCGHCKKLVPIYEELGEKYKDNKNVIIAKMDSTANEVDSVSVSGFPTLKWFPADSDEVVDYDGARELDDFVKFIDEKLNVE